MYDIECSCPNCLIYGVVVTMHVDLTQKEPVYHCPCCGEMFTNDDLIRIFEQRSSERSDHET
jgi:hypothetical protein